MRSFFSGLQNALFRFMYGRNGSDQLNRAIMGAYLGLWLVRVLLGGLDSTLLHGLLSALMTALAAVLIWRTFSKNLPRRRAENQRFLAWWQPIRGRLTGARARRQDKAHKYFTCKACKTICRVPAGKGKIIITCPKCGGKIQGKS